MAYPVIDLSVAMTALYLAELDLLLGDRLDPALGRRIRYEVDRRCLVPYLQRHDHPWLFDSPDRPVNNWSAVCNAGVAGAAIHLEPDAARLAEILARAARSLDDYLSTFDEDGGSTEGPAYWSYGFGYYTLLAHLVGHRTGWRVDFFDDEHVSRIACFPSRTRLSPGLYVNFSDCDVNAGFMPAHLSYLSRRLDLPDLTRLLKEQPGGGERERELTWALRDLFWHREHVEGRFVPARHDWFGGMMWMVARQDPEDPGALALATKGGHNGELHNQNDVGNVIVHVDRESVISDIGRGRYTKAYFGPERYEHIANSSRGHSVPVPNGQEQQPGGEHGARLLEHRAGDHADLAAFELRDAYPPEADLDSLRRTVVLRRDESCASVELMDEVRFATGSWHLRERADHLRGGGSLPGLGAATRGPWHPTRLLRPRSGRAADRNPRRRGPGRGTGRRAARVLRVSGTGQGGFCPPAHRTGTGISRRPRSIVAGNSMRVQRDARMR